MLLLAERISMNYGGRQLLDNVSFHMNNGDKVGIVGVNGAGKTTFLNILSGELIPDSGEVQRDPNVQITKLSQNPDMSDNNTILEQVFAEFPKEFRQLNEYEAKAMLQILGFSDTTIKVSTLSGGQKKRVALAIALIHPSDILILDEPTNHLDSEMVIWLEERLLKFTGSIIMITHDRYFLERVANNITEIHQGSLYHYEANYSEFLDLKEQRMEMAQATERKRQAVLKLEFQWISRGCRARTTKSKERIERYENLKNLDTPTLDSTLEIATGKSQRLGRKLIELENICKSYGEKIVLKDVSYVLGREDRIGIIGHNGAGKSTLLKIIAGELKPDNGEISTGSTVKIGHFSQEGKELDLNMRVYDFIHNISDDIQMEQLDFSPKEMMEQFMFPPSMQSTLIGRLSGGERRRLYLLSILMQGPNILLLDEPTNDLDITTLAILEEYLQHFKGPVITVSHDRWFLDKLVHQIFEVGDNGQVSVYLGNWTEYAEKTKNKTMDTHKIVEKKSAPKPRSQQKLKFSFNEQREYNEIDDNVAKAEEEISVCENKINNCGSDYVLLQQLQKELEEKNVHLEHLYERWEYLNDLKEKIELGQ